MSDEAPVENKSKIELVGNTLVENFMTKDVFSAKSSITVKQAIEMLLDKKVSGMPLVDMSGYILSVVSEFDLMQFAALGKYDTALGMLTANLSPREKVITVKRTDSFKDAFKHFLSGRVRRVIVAGPTGKVEGIVSRRDVLRAFLTAEKNSQNAPGEKKAA